MNYELGIRNWLVSLLRIVYSLVILSGAREWAGAVEESHTTEMKVREYSIFQFTIKCSGMRSLHTGRDDKKERGFTLIELIVYMGLFTILITALSIVFLSLLDQQSESESISAADQNGRYILTRLTNDIQQAKSVSLPSTYGGQSSSLQISINSINYTYNVSNGNLQLTRSDSIGPDNLNGYDAVISNLNFQRIGQSGGRDSVQVSFTVSSLTTMHAVAETRTYQTTAGLRCTVSGC